MRRIARVVMKDGRRFGRPADPHTPPAEPTGTINTTDHDSWIVRTQGQPAIQGCNAQAAVNENQIIIAAELTVDSPDFGHLEPISMQASASCRTLASPSHRTRSSPTLATGTSSRSVSRASPALRHSPWRSAGAFSDGHRQERVSHELLRHNPRWTTRVQAKRERRSAPACNLVIQSRSPALADIIGARRARTATMVSSGSMPWR
jgi:hypothetical protein